MRAWIVPAVRCEDRAITTKIFVAAWPKCHGKSLEPWQATVVNRNLSNNIIQLS